MSGIDPNTVLEWLHKGGYPLEYEVARVLRAAGFRAVQGFMYTDPTDNTTRREADVVASPQLTANTKAEVALVIECKAGNQGRPWVLLTSAEATTDWHPLAKSGIGVHLLRQMWPSVRGLLPIDKPPGFGLVERPDPEADDFKRRDRTHDALQQVVSAARGAALSSKGQLFAFPVLVTDGELFRYVVDQAGREELTPVERLRFAWPGARTLNHATLVDVVTRSGFEAYARDMRHTLGELVDEIVRSGFPAAS